MSIKDFKKLSRNNNYSVATRAVPAGDTSKMSLKQLLIAKTKKVLMIERNSRILAIIPLVNDHHVAEFTMSNPKKRLSQPEFNLIAEFTHNQQKSA